MDETITRLVMAFGWKTVVDAVTAAAIRYTVAAVAAGIAAVFAVASLGCAVAALWLFELPRIGPVEAPLVAAGALLVPCLAALALAWRITARTPRATQSGEAADILIAGATRFVKEHGGTAALAALVAGMIAGTNRFDR